MDRILHDANNAQRILKLTADTMLLVDRHGVCVDIEPHCDLWFLQDSLKGPWQWTAAAVPRRTGRNHFPQSASHIRLGDDG